MTVTFERIKGWLARIGPDHRKYGDPYQWTCIVDREGAVKGLPAGWGVSYEWVDGWLAYIGAPYKGTCVVCLDGKVKGLSGTLSPGLISEARKAAEAELGLTLRWKRIRDMAKYRVVLKGYEITKIEGDTETCFNSGEPVEWNNVPYEGVLAMQKEVIDMFEDFRKIGEKAASAKK